MLDVVTIGDAMITFNPHSYGPMRYVNSFEKKIGGAELNLAIGCARLGLKTGMVSRLGNDEFGKYILNFIRGEGIDTSHIKLVDGYPTSINFKEIMEGGNGRTFYYRDNSPTLTLSMDGIIEKYIENAKVLHISGVFPSINSKNNQIINHAISIAKRNKVLISLDPNIRLKLWSKAQAKRTLTEYLPFVDIFLTGEEEGEILFGSKDAIQIIKSAKEYGINTIAVKRGALGAVAYDNGKIIESNPVVTNNVIDTVGAGDGFDAGFLYGLLNNYPLQKTLHLSNMIGSMVVEVSGDNEGLPYLDEVLARLGEKEIIDR